MIQNRKEYDIVKERQSKDALTNAKAQILINGPTQGHANVADRTTTKQNLRGRIMHRRHQPTHTRKTMQTNTQQVRKYPKEK